MIVLDKIETMKDCSDISYCSSLLFYDSENKRYGIRLSTFQPKQREPPYVDVIMSLSEIEQMTSLNHIKYAYDYAIKTHHNYKPVLVKLTQSEWEYKNNKEPSFIRVFPCDFEEYIKYGEQIFSEEECDYNMYGSIISKSVIVNKIFWIPPNVLDTLSTQEKIM